MTHDLTIEGVSYISSKRASEITGYSQDYIGQLARAGKILGKRVGGLWYVIAESVSKHKSDADAYVPVPPIKEDKTSSSSDSSIVTFEGKTYVSAARAAKQTSYHVDYIGQLARSGKIISRQLGRRWYVDIEALKQHKKEKDALLGAVQSSSVGIAGNSEVYVSNAGSNQPKDLYDVGLHYTYKAESTPLIPVIDPRVIESSEQQDQTDVRPNIIPIHVVKPLSFSPPKVNRIVEKSGASFPGKSIFSKLFPVLLVAVIVFIVFNLNLLNLRPEIAKVAFRPQFTAIKEFVSGYFPAITDILTIKITYTRD